MKEGLTAEDLEWKQEVENLVLTIKDTGETLTFTNWYKSTFNPVDKVQFADGTTLTTQEINALANPPAAMARSSFSAPIPYDLTMQQIAYASIAFDGDSGNLGCAETAAGSTMAADASAAFTFGYADDLNSSRQMSSYMQTRK